MKAIGFKNQNIELEILKIKKPQIKKADEVEIKMLYSGICGSDLNPKIINLNKITYPHIIGHEGIGKVTKIGKNVTSVKINDLVCFETHLFCDQCSQCKQNKRFLCENLKTLGFTTNGVWSEYIVLPERILYNLKNIDLPLDILTILEPLGNVFHLLSYSKLENKKIAIFGDGQIGLMASLIINSLKNTNVVLFGINKFRKKIAQQWKINYIDFSKQEINKYQNNFDIIFEVSGNENAFQSAINCVAKNGEINVLSLYKKTEINLKINNLVYKNIKLQFVYGRRIWKSWIQTVNFLLTNKEVVKKLQLLISDKFFFEKFKIAFKKIQQQKSSKVFLSFIKKS